MQKINSSSFTFQGKSEKWDSRSEFFWSPLRSETRDQSYGWDRDPKGGTQDSRPGTFLLHGTKDPRSKTLKEGSGTLMVGENRDPKQASHVEPGNQELWSKWT